MRGAVLALSVLASISAVVAEGGEHPRINVTVYRITPRNYTGLTNLDTGDPAGDAFFGLLELSKPLFNCSDPTVAKFNLFCKNAPILQIPGFNVYTKSIAEIDARFGEYSACNPDPDNGTFVCQTFGSGFGRNGSQCWHEDPRFATAFVEDCDPAVCRCPAVYEQAMGQRYIAGLFNHSSPPPDYPKQCATKYYPLPLIAVKRGPHTRIVFARDEGACCSACTESACKAYTFRAQRHTCELHSDPVDYSSGIPDKTALSGFFVGNSPWQSPLGDAPAELSKILNGSWYSTRKEGECMPGQVPGRDGCYWRLVETVRTVNASCVNDHVISAVQAKRPECWRDCPQPGNMTSACWIFCLFETMVGNKTKGIPPMAREEITRPFKASFESDDPSKGGCVEVPPCPPPCRPPGEAEVDFLQGDSATLVV